MSAAPLLHTAEVVPLASLRPHPRNYHAHPEEELTHLRQSLQEHGFYRNVVIAQDNTILAGHGVVTAALALGWTHGPVVRLPLAPDHPQALKVLVGDNETRRLGLLDDPALATLLQEIAEDGAAALLGTGFDTESLQALLDSVGAGNGTGGGDGDADVEPQIDRAEELRKQWGVEVGQLWQLGAHRLICGDCTDKAVVARLVGHHKADLIFTDPPYNVGGESRNYAADVREGYAALQRASWDQAFDIQRLFPCLDGLMADACTVYICTSQWLAHDIWQWMWSWSKFCHYIVWCKPNPMPSLAKRHWTWATELIAYAVRGDHVCNFPETGHALNWWELVSPTHSTSHPTEKPVSIPQRALEFSSNPGALVYDGFLGAGTTLIACEHLQRQCYGCEIDPGYVAVTLQRWADLTGQTPVCIY